MLLLTAISFLISFLACAFLVALGENSVANYSQDMPQRFHKGHVSRFGGLAILLATVFGWIAAWLFSAISVPISIPIDAKHLTALLLVCCPIVIAGLADDWTQKVSVRWRLLAGVCSAALACVLLDLRVPSLGISAIDSLLIMMPLISVSIAFAGVAGFPHAMNLIDGYNGLAVMVSLMICGALAYLALQLGDRAMAGSLACVIGASIGFLFWNYPRGLIFAGDGGAYFWGIIIAVSSISLVQRHPQISPWFVMLLLIYPVWETLFSIYRKLVRGQSPGMADSMHFHQLVYKRIVRGVFHDNETRQMLMRNNRTSPYLWAFASLTVAPAVLFWYSTPILIFFCVLFVVSYVAAYLMIIRFKVPRWLRPKRQRH